MNPGILQIAGPGVVYLFITGILWRCVFGSLLDDFHEKLTNSRMDFLLLPGRFKDRDFYIRFYKVLCIVIFVVVTVFYVLLAMVAFGETGAR